jgi:hypothetical protein
VSIARVIGRLREMAYRIGPPFRKPAARFYRDAERLRLEQKINQCAWGFFGLANEVLRVGQRACEQAPPRRRRRCRVRFDVESSVPVVKSRTVSDSLRECGASHVSSSQKIPCRPQVWGHFQRLPSYPARIRLHSRNCTRTALPNWPPSEHSKTISFCRAGRLANRCGRGRQPHLGHPRHDYACGLYAPFLQRRKGSGARSMERSTAGNHPQQDGRQGVASQANQARARLSATATPYESRSIAWRSM